MAPFRYRAVSASGELLRGEMQAASADEVITRLQDQGHVACCRTTATRHEPPPSQPDGLQSTTYAHCDSSILTRSRGTDTVSVQVDTVGTLDTRSRLVDEFPVPYGSRIGSGNLGPS